MNTLVIYHKNCYDGFGAAWSAWRSLGESAEYFAAQYGDEPPDVTGKIVYILDFSYKREQLLTMKSQSEKILVIDHHASAKKDLQGLDFCIFDMGHSGAILTWKYFFGDTAPRFLEYIEDRDLWKWKLPNSQKINAAISTYDFSFEVFDNFLGVSVDWFVGEGEAIIRFREKNVKMLCENAREIIIGGYKVWCVNSPLFYSEIAHEIIRDRKFGVCYRDVSDRRMFDLRSVGDFDVSEIAKQYGGGGHRNAAGFQLAFNSPMMPLK